MSTEALEENRTFVESMAPHPSRLGGLGGDYDDWVTLKEKGAISFPDRTVKYSSTIRLETTTSSLYLHELEIWNDYFSFITRYPVTGRGSTDRKLVRGLSLAELLYLSGYDYQDKRSFKIFYDIEDLPEGRARELRHKPLMIDPDHYVALIRVYDLFTTDDGIETLINRMEGNLYGVNTKTLKREFLEVSGLPVAQYHIRERYLSNIRAGDEDAIRPTDTRIGLYQTLKALMNGTRNVLSSFSTGSKVMGRFNIQDGKGGFARRKVTSRKLLTDPVRWKLQQTFNDIWMYFLYRRLISLARAIPDRSTRTEGLRDLVIRQDGRDQEEEIGGDFFNKFRPVSLSRYVLVLPARYYEQLTPGRNESMRRDETVDFEPALPSDKGADTGFNFFLQLYEEICSGKRFAIWNEKEKIDIKLDIISPTVCLALFQLKYSTEIFGLTGSEARDSTFSYPVTTTDTFQGLTKNFHPEGLLNWVDFYLLNVNKSLVSHLKRLCLFLP
ncbi:putative phage DNA-directed RNA polymerase beta subunit [Salmonella phage SPFM8]|nr:putative phage DNA-directed RNA polymerase beta subunit [Salmonella phage SPFM8]